MPVSLKIQAQRQNKQNLLVNHKQRQASDQWSMEPSNIYGGKAISNKCVFSFLPKVAIVSEVLIMIVN